MPFTLPSGTKVAGVTTGLTSDLNNLYAAMGPIGAINVQNAAYAGGADPTGTTDSGPAFNAAGAAAVAANGGLIVIPPGVYKITTPVAVNCNSQCVVWWGPGARVFSYLTTGTCFTMSDSSILAFTSRNNGSGILGGIIFDGTNASAGTTLVQVSDFFQFRMDLIASCLTSQTNAVTGVRFLNQVFYSEQMQARIYAQNCSPGVVFDCVSTGTTSTGSFSRGQFQIFIDQFNPTWDGVVFQNGAGIIDGVLGIYGNFSTSTPAVTSAVLRVTGTGGHPSTPAAIVGSVINIGVELDGAALGHQPQTIVFGASGSIGSCTGILDFNLGGSGSAFSQSNAFGQFQYSGIISGDPALQRTTFDGEFTQAITTGSTITARLGNVVVETNGGVASTGNIIQTGQYPGQILKVINKGAASVTFAASGTSNVAAGVAVVIAANTSRQFIWESTAALWY